jgi:hypothetical protein
MANDNQKKVEVEEVPTSPIESTMRVDKDDEPQPKEQMDVGAYKKMLENNTSVLKKEYEQLDYLVKLAKLRIEYKQLLEAQK